jgi:hypothetical protein
MTIGRAILLLSAAAVLSLSTCAKQASAFLATSPSTSSSTSSMTYHPRGGIAYAPPPKMAAESEVSFSDDLDGSTIRIGVLRTRWNDVHVSNLVEGIKVSILVTIFAWGVRSFVRLSVCLFVCLWVGVLALIHSYVGRQQKIEMMKE